MLLGAVADENNVLFRLRESLREMIDPDFLLLNELMSRDVITDADRQRVKSHSCLQDRNDALLELILDKDDAAQRRFIACLHDSDQDHVVNFINYDGGTQYIGLLYLSLKPKFKTLV